MSTCFNLRQPQYFFLGSVCTVHPTGKFRSLLPLISAWIPSACPIVAYVILLFFHVVFTWRIKSSDRKRSVLFPLNIKSQFRLCRAADKFSFSYLYGFIYAGNSNRKCISTVSRPHNKMSGNTNVAFCLFFLPSTPPPISPKCHAYCSLGIFPAYY